MKQKKYFILAAAATLFAACSSDDGLVAEKQAAAQEAEDGTIVFDAYQSRSTTRAGKEGIMTLSLLTQAEASGGGFGVFAYYTDGERYASNSKPNFMYNQGVFFDTDHWKYIPVKYWPNEFGTDAISDQADRLSFFAYAPYVSVDPLTGIVNGTGVKNTENITGLTRNNATGDPFVKYTSTMDASNSVDLCRGVAYDDPFNSSTSTETAYMNTITKGEPFIDVLKPAVSGKIKFDFKHALARLNVQINAAVDKSTVGYKLSDSTKIWVRSVIFEGIAMKGALNLRTGEWYQIDASGDNKISTGTVTVYDGLKDGKEPIGAAANELPANLNPVIIQAHPYDKATTTKLVTTAATETGVTHESVNLFKPTSEKTDPVFVIPTGEKFKVTIVYDVETWDKNLAYYLSDGVTPGSTIQNCITKEITDFGATGLEAGKQYTLLLHLGMNSVHFDASVTAWDATTPIEEEENLPKNKD